MQKGEREVGGRHVVDIVCMQEQVNNDLTHQVNNTIWLLRRSPVTLSLVGHNCNLIYKRKIEAAEMTFLRPTARYTL